MQTINSLIPIVGVLSLIFAVGALLLAVFPGNRKRRLKISGAMLAIFLVTLIASQPVKQAADKQALAQAGVSTRAELLEKQQQQKAESKALAVATYVNRVNAQINDLRELKVRDFIESVEAIMVVLLLFDISAQIIEEGKDFELTPDQDNEIQNLKQTLSRKQIEVFPAIRDAYGPALRKNLWEHDGYARTLGTAYRRIEIVSALFAANRNIADFHNTVLATLLQLRFTRVDYKWIRQASEYSYFKLEPPSDGVIGYWTNSRFNPVD
jgi:hypothetical protein